MTNVHPAGFHVHIAIGQYTIVNQQNMNKKTGPIRDRSANPPMASTQVITANMHW
jgi:hypothetical protein